MLNFTFSFPCKFLCADIITFFVVFEPYKDKKVDLMLPTLVFIALNLVGLGLGVWKVGLLISVEVILNHLVRKTKQGNALSISFFVGSLTH